MSGNRDPDQLLFEQAVAALEGASASKLAKIKGERSARSEPEAVLKSRALGGSRRLSKLRKSAKPEAVIDLHGLDRKSAMSQVKRFISVNRDRELLLIVHGKGRGVLQQQVTACLSEESAVVEHAVAPQRLGGSGARLVRLRRG